MDAVLAALTAQHAELAGYLDGLDDADWHRPSRCDGWDVSDVVLHLAQTDEMAAGSARGRFAEALDELVAGIDWAESVDDGAGLMVDRQRGAPPQEVYERWRSGTDDLVAALSTTDPHARLVWVAGELSARTLATTRLSEAWIHTGDVAFAFGITPSPTDRLWHIARLAWRTVPYAFERAGRTLDGPVDFELVGPAGERWEFAGDEPAHTIVHGTALDLCLVAGQRAEASATSLTATGSDADAVLELVRTFA